jgi:fimbrial isopeptide formation D2 family protein/LPXTG-motif cell wall-anchored protein
MAMGFAPITPALAADGDLTVDDKVTVTGFEDGDTITAYKFINWVDGEGWELAEGITGITLDDIVDGLDKDELGTLAGQIDKMTSVTGTTDGGKWELECGTVDKAGSYLILVSSGTAVQYIYNPAVVSADFDGTNAKAVDLTEDDAKIKKQEITVDKKADDVNDYAIQAGDIVPFTVSVTVPQYNSNWTEPYFAVTDVLSDGLVIKTAPTIEGLTPGTDLTVPGTDYSIIEDGNEGDAGFTIQFSEAYLKGNASAVVDIKYTALVTEAVKVNDQVNEETNKVTLEFSHNPSDISDHNTVDDETHHYTFAIDATRLGQGSEKTNELIKVGVDADGNPVTVFKEGEELPTGVAPLAGAVFTLTGVGPEGEGQTVLTATSDADGRVFFNDLDTGTYTLKETKAPAGYIKDGSEHEIVIAAEFNEDTTLKSYTITIDGNEATNATSTYTATTNSNNVVEYTVPGDGNPSFPINNKKGTELPSTGGIGTTIFYVVGGVMVAGAVVFLLTKRRMAGNE